VLVCDDSTREMNDALFVEDDELGFADGAKLDRRLRSSNGSQRRASVLRRERTRLERLTVQLQLQDWRA
jgi:hypothetical protein